jgi:hypothetical protein
MTKHLLLAYVAISIFLSIGECNAQQAGDVPQRQSAPDAGEVPPNVASLQNENQELRRENELLKKRLLELGIKAESPTTQDAADTGGVEKQKTASIPSLESLLKGIPLEYRQSENGGWDQFTMPKVEKWLQTNLRDKKCSVTTTLGAVRMRQDDPAGKPDEWTVQLFTNGYASNFCGMLNVIAPQQFEVPCNEATAQTWDTYNKRRPAPIQVTGVFQQAKFEPNFLDGKIIGYSVAVELSEVTITPRNDAELIALAAATEQISTSIQQAGGTVEAFPRVLRLESNGDYQLVFASVLYFNSDGTKTANMLVGLKLQGSGKSTYDKNVAAEPCSDAPTPSEVASVKQQIGWPGPAR